MAFFVGNPKYNDIKDYHITLTQPEDIDKDDIFGVEFYNMVTDDNEIPDSIGKVTPHQQVKAARLFSAANLQFSPAYTEEGKTEEFAGIDQFLQYAGPFQIKECAMIYDSTTKKQKVVAYREDIDSDTWMREYENIGTTAAKTKATVKRFADTTKTQTNLYNTYNIMIEFPKFWYCRPSKYTFLVSTKDRSSEYFVNNGVQIPWHVAPMFRRKNESGTGYNEYEKVYISKYLMSKLTGTPSGTPNGDSYTSIAATTSGTDDYAVSTRSVPNKFPAQTYNSTSVMSPTGAKRCLKNSGMYQMDYAVFCSLYHLVFVKYATVNFLDYIGRLFSTTSKNNVAELPNNNNVNAALDFCDSIYRMEDQNHKMIMDARGYIKPSENGKIKVNTVTNSPKDKVLGLLGHFDWAYCLDGILSGKVKSVSVRRKVYDSYGLPVAETNTTRINNYGAQSTTSVAETTNTLFITSTLFEYNANRSLGFPDWGNFEEAGTTDTGKYYKVSSYNNNLVKRCFKEFQTTTGNIETTFGDLTWSPEMAADEDLAWGIGSTASYNTGEEGAFISGWHMWHLNHYSCQFFRTVNMISMCAGNSTCNGVVRGCCHFTKDELMNMPAVVAKHYSTTS